MKEATATIAGAVTYWSLGEWSDVTKVRDALAYMGLDAFAPEPPTPAVAMRRALVETFRKRRKLVRPLAAGKFAVVDEKHAGDDLEYAVELRAAAGDDGTAFEPFDHPAVPAIDDAYARFRSLVPASAVGTAITQLARHLGGVRLRDSGGVFWLPKDALAQWASVARAFEEAAIKGGTVVYRLRTAIDDDAVRAVTDAITKDVEETVAEIKGKVREQVRGKALQRRADEAAAMEARIGQYEAILGTTLDALRAKQKEAEREASLAVLAAMGGGEDA